MSSAADQPSERSAALSRIGAVLDRLGEIQILVVGDMMLDEYRIGEVDRISPEAPVPVVRDREHQFALGGAGNVARGVLALGASCRLVTILGNDREGDQATQLMAEAGLAPGDIVRVPGRVTSHKLRVVARGQQMLRLDREEETEVSEQVRESIRERVAAALPGSQVLILQDYDKGLLGRELVRWLIREAQKKGVLVVADPKTDLIRYRGVDLIKPNLAEALNLVPAQTDSLEGRRGLLEKIAHQIGGAEVVVTRGAEGMSALDREGQVTDLPTRAAEVFDVQGAGDTTVAVLALCRAAGANLVEACIVANAAAAIAVGKRGTATLDLGELRARVPDAWDRFKGKQ